MSNNALDRLAESSALPSRASEATAIEQVRAVAEVAAAVRVAQEFPRNEMVAFGRMREACADETLAQRAFYSLPRAGGRVDGSTIHLARALAACWGNIDYGIRELRRDDEAGISEMQAWSWDQQTNTRSSRSFIVQHQIMAKGGRKKLTDLADIANNNNSVAARQVRETIFAVLPLGYVAAAEEACRATLRGESRSQSDGGNLQQQIETLLAGFQKNVGVSRQRIEAALALPVSDWDADTLANLRILAGEIARGEKKVEDEFPDDLAAEIQGAKR